MDKPAFPTFPRNFVWGVSTAAYQIEGATREDGRGRSSWDAFVAQPGRVVNGDTGDVACDHYHRYREDTAFMKDLGIDAYRFSFSWPRIQPGGKGAVNAAGLGFYDKLVDGLLEAGIVPTPTLFHWDTPLELEETGGWLNRETAERFAEYAHIVGSHFADRIPRWITINEPVVLTMLGYGAGIQAPGLALGFDALPAAHNLLLAHGLGVQALRSAGAGNIGIANNHAATWPASEHEEDLRAAGLYDTIANWIFADPILTGAYPPELEPFLPKVPDADLAVISTPIDWYGINSYNPTLVGAPTAGEAALVDGHELDASLPFSLREIEGVPRTDFDWPVVPEAFTELLLSFKERYGEKLPPIYITENGAAFNDGPDNEGRVRDARRIDYTDAHLRALKVAMDAGVDVRGYFQWSLLDNFEWAVGFSQRFGLVHVDYQTQKRTPKDSYHWYRELIRSNKERPAAAAPTATTSCGEVRGEAADGVEHYWAIPYAAAPVGDLRFALPSHAMPWDGVRDGTSPGPTAPQNPYGGALARILPTVEIPGDNFLNVHIATPAGRGPELLPVMVWFHGGSLQHGSNALDGYRGSSFARDGVVFVAANYRLGAEGFSVLEGAPLNLGLADQMAALRWVQAEISSFGGDPARVTVFGQSAGGNTVSALLAHPDAPSLFSRAIIQSGPLSADPPARAGRITRKIAKDLKIPATREAFARQSPATLLAAQARVTAGSTPLTGGPSYALAVEPELVRASPAEALATGAGASIPLLIGTTTDEARLWLVPTGLVMKIKALHLALARRKVGISAAALKLYKRNRSYAVTGEILGDLATDKLLRVPMNQLADARLAGAAPTFVYEFAWPSPVEYLRAAHAVELGFVFDDLASADSLRLAGSTAPAELATAMHRAWVDFAVTGSPGWEQWSAQRPVKTFDGGNNPVVFAPRDDERAALTP